MLHACSRSVNDDERCRVATHCHRGPQHDERECDRFLHAAWDVDVTQPELLQRAVRDGAGCDPCVLDKRRHDMDKLLHVQLFELLNADRIGHSDARRSQIACNAVFVLAVRSDIKRILDLPN